MRKCIVAALAVALIAGLVFGLDRADYRVFWTRPDGTVIGGITNTGRLDILDGANFGSHAEIDGNLTITGTISVGAGTVLPEPWSLSEDLTLEATADLIAGKDVTIAGALSAEGAVTFGATGSEFTIAAATGNTAIEGELGVEGEVTFEDTLLVHGIITSGDDTADSIGGLVIKDDSGVSKFTVLGDSGNTTIAGTVGATGLATLSGGLYTYGAAHRIGFDGSAYVNIAVTETTGATAITHEGSGAAVTWTAPTFGFTGNTTLTGTLTATGAAILESTLLVHGALTLGDDTADTVGSLTIKDDSGVTHATIAGDTGNAMFAGSVTIGDNTADTHGYLQMNDDGGLGRVSLWGETGTVDAWSTVNIGSNLHGGAHGQLNVKDEADATTFSVDGETGNVTTTGNITHTGATNAGALMVTQFSFDWEDTESDLEVGVLPANAHVLEVKVATTAEFTGGTSATTIDIGWDPTKNGYAASLNIAPAEIHFGSTANLGDVGATPRTILMDLTTTHTAGAATIYVYWTMGTPGTPPENG